MVKVYDKLEQRIQDIDDKRHKFGNDVNNALNSIRTDLHAVDSRVISNTNDINTLAKEHVDIKELVTNNTTALNNMNGTFKEMTGAFKVLQWIGGLTLGIATLYGIYHGIN